MVCVGAALPPSVTSTTHDLPLAVMLTPSGDASTMRMMVTSGMSILLALPSRATRASPNSALTSFDGMSKASHKAPLRRNAAAGNRLRPGEHDLGAVLHRHDLDLHVNRCARRQRRLLDLRHRWRCRLCRLGGLLLRLRRFLSLGRFLGRWWRRCRPASGSAGRLCSANSGAGGSASGCCAGDSAAGGVAAQAVARLAARRSSLVRSAWAPARAPPEWSAGCAVFGCGLAAVCVLSGRRSAGAAAVCCSGRMMSSTTVRPRRKSRSRAPGASVR